MSLVSLLPRKGISRRVVAAGIVATLTTTAGAAYAYFTATGSGLGAATVGTMQTVTVSALAGGDAPGSLLYPGGPAADVILRVDNPNA